MVRGGCSARIEVSSGVAPLVNKNSSFAFVELAFRTKMLI